MNGKETPTLPDHIYKEYLTMNIPTRVPASGFIGVFNPSVWLHNFTTIFYSRFLCEPAKWLVMLIMARWRSTTGNLNFLLRQIQCVRQPSLTSFSICLHFTFTDIFTGGPAKGKHVIE